MGRVLNTIRNAVPVLGVITLVAGATACGSDSDDAASTEPAEASTEQAAEATSEQDTEASTEQDAERPRIVVTTNILGDVVASAVGDQADVEVIMPLGSDPHDFAPSARQAESMENADLLVVNGAGFEEGMLDIIDNVSDFGTEVFSFADQIDLLQFTGDHGHGHGDDHSDDDHSDDDHSDDDHSDDDHSDDEHGDDDHSDDDHSDDDHSDDEHDDHSDEGGNDPHLWTDPTRVAAAVEALEPIVANLEGVDSDELAASVDAYLSELSALESSMNETLAAVPDERRVLVTNHAVFGYFADRFDFEVVGAVIPSLTTNAEPSAAAIEELAELIEAEGIPAIFGETTQSSTLANVLADEVGGAVEVVELFSESLGEDGSGAETYVEMMQLNADLIAEALAA